MNEHFCDLPNPLKAHIKIDGAYEHAEITKLYFKEPTARHCYISLKQIRGFITKCAMQMSSDKKQEVEQQETEAKFDAKALLTIISLDADVCEIYTDVDGVFSADPRVVPSAQKLKSDLMPMFVKNFTILFNKCFVMVWFFLMRKKNNNLN